ncbi:exopolysaccharide synthesis membrane protein H (exosortase) [Citrifermentans bemidjiense Bem]|uniref:Exopolysaccharide synthesis membrane protein H (Exosortase) n=1 Tax=Citrifermentans bemidjiense (strain ATCC BAA-1014 / DSM 16622 / JCM 12645 / Bem) TaxID=404380 RepID=B5EAB3_CITBB|nr:exosortase A [Citrifermentans bemidjiense]ACH38819.1 exopolysaccharide synthesis membrane protein H (exosortase) [Citrifermentans bemidjiense Bem]
MTVAECLKHHRVQFLLVLLILAAVYWSVVPEMVQQWYEDENYSHGFVVPLIAGYFAYERRKDLASVLAEPWWPGLLLVVAGLMQLVVGWLGTEFFTMRSSLVVTLCGMTLFLLGKRLFRLMLLPLAYLLFMVPLPYIIYDMVAFPLKLFVTRVSIATLKLMGVVVMREGNIIMLPFTTLEVADACSGIRSLISLLALAVAYAFFLEMGQLRRGLLILAAIPIAISANALRVIGTGVLAQYWGARAAEGFFHEFAGLAVFVVAIALMIGLGSLLSRGKGGAA